jgi:hypothetical protein
MNSYLENKVLAFLKKMDEDSKGHDIAEYGGQHFSGCYGCLAHDLLVEINVSKEMELEPPKTRVVHCKRWSYQKKDYVYIGRPSKWGNPFYCPKEERLGKLGNSQLYITSSLEESLSKYEEWLESNPELKKLIHTELKGKVLGCWCRPEEGFGGRYLCHGQYLASIAEGCKPEEIE